jgi:NADPH-dependent ferric siderophore reductase
MLTAPPSCGIASGMSRPETTKIPEGFTARGIKTWELTIASVDDLGGAMRRIALTGPALEAFACEPGNDMMVPLAEDGGPTVCRRYTIRHFDRASRRLELDLVLHGEGIGSRWASSAAVGDVVELGGPRGKITLATDAAWHLFAGDESAIPATFAMMEALPEGVWSRALLSIAQAGAEQPHRLRADDQVTWVHRLGGTDATRAFVDALSGVPAGRGHVYIAGESMLVAALKKAALARGLTADQVSAKAYWARDRVNGGHGEP